MIFVNYRVIVFLVVFVNTLFAVGDVFAMRSLFNASSDGSCKRFIKVRFNRRAVELPPIVDSENKTAGATDGVLTKPLGLIYTQEIHQRVKCFAQKVRAIVNWHSVDFEVMFNEIKTFLFQIEDVCCSFKNARTEPEVCKNFSEISFLLEEAVRALDSHAKCSKPDAFALDMAPKNIHREADEIIKRLRSDL